MPQEKLFFVTLKEHRDGYFVEYSPPTPSNRLATLNLVFPKPVDLELMTDAMEREVKSWIDRYPVPLMGSAFDEKGDLVDLTPVRPYTHLIGIKEGGQVRLLWELIGDDRIPADALDSGYLIKVYEGISWKTEKELRLTANADARRFRIGWLIVVLWLTVIPASWEIVQWAGPAWLATLVMMFGIWKSFSKAMILLGKRRKSVQEMKKEEEERRKEHYFYHCERNPEGFLRLKVENFESEAREEIQNEARILRLKADDRK